MKLMLSVVLLTVVGFGLSALPAGAESAADVLARAKQASGGAAWDGVTSIYTKAKLSAGGMTGTAESWEDTLKGRTYGTFAIGPMTGAQGFDGKVLWVQDSSKQVRIDDSDDARLGALNEAYRRTMAYWYPARGEALIEYTGKKTEGNRSFETLRITPKNVRPFDLWIDASTGLIDRVVEKSALETRTTLYSDYRPVDGVKVPFVSRSTNGQERYDQVGTVERVELNVPLKDEMFRVPPPPAPDFEMAGGRTSTTIPFDLINNHIYLEARLNGKGPFRMLCDTGGSNIVTPELAKELGLESEGTVEGRGVGEKSEDVGLTKVGSLQVGDVTLKDQVFAVFNLAAMKDVEDVPFQGLIGYEVFKRFVVAIDYEHGRLTLTLPAAFSYKGTGTVVPFKFNGTIPQVEGELDGIPGKFDIDTGGRSSLTVLAPFVERHGLKARYGAKVEAVVGWGVGGPHRGLVARTKVLKLGGVPVENVIAELSLSTRGSFVDPYVAGNVGAGVLKRFNIVFDYAQQKMILEPNGNASLPDTYDRAGFWLNRAGDAFLVVDVTAGAPAAEAGIKVGDKILKVDGRSASTLNLGATRTKFRTSPVGTKVVLTVESGGAVREVVLTLRDLV